MSISYEDVCAFLGRDIVLTEPIEDGAIMTADYKSTKDLKITMLDQHYSDDKEVIAMVQDELQEDIESHGGIASAYVEVGTLEGFVSMVLEETNSMPSNEDGLSDLRLFFSNEENKQRFLEDSSLEPPFIWYMALTDNRLEEPFSIHCNPDGTYTNSSRSDSGYYTEGDTDSDSD